MSRSPEILKAVESYYSDKIREHGISPKGVDWNSSESQNLRFQELLKVIKDQEEFSLLDYGCGYGALLDYITDLFTKFDYTGFDISSEMLKKAKEQNGVKKGVTWLDSLEDEVCDYSLASGIFNVRLDQHESAWKKYIEATLIELNQRSKKGFSFNMLTKYSDKEYMRQYLHYADPSYYFDFCKKHFSKYVALLHDYPLYEFTIIVRK